MEKFLWITTDNDKTVHENLLDEQKSCFFFGRLEKLKTVFDNE